MESTVAERRFDSLGRNPDFAKLWVGQDGSLLDNQIRPLALPLAAVLALSASPAQMGILKASQQAPWLLMTLLAGAWVDRLPRRPVMIYAQLGSALVIASIPVAAILGVLRMEQLNGVAFLAATLFMTSRTAHNSYVPWLVGRERLVEANSKISIGSSTADIVGSGAAGWLVEIVTAPFALVASVSTLVTSAASIGLIGKPEPTPKARPAGRDVLAEIGEGLKIVLGNPLLRPIVGSASVHNFSSSAVSALVVLYATRGLGIQPVALGVIFAFSGPGSLVGAFLAPSVTRRLGMGPTIAGALALSGVAKLLVPVAGSLPLVAVPMLAVEQLVSGFADSLYSINTSSVRQAITPHELQGRVGATRSFVTLGVTPLGALLGGGLGQIVGLQIGVTLMALGALAAFAWVLLSPVRALREQPSPLDGC